MHAKKGLSDIVTAILIILLVLVAIGIIWAFLRPVISEGAGQVEGIADVYSTILTIESQSAQLDETTQTVSFVVSRGSGTGSIAGITSIIEDGSGNTKSFRNETVLGSLDSRRIYVHYGSSGLGKPVSVAVVPMFGTSSGQERLGSESNKVSVSTSTGGGGECTSGSTRSCTVGGYAGTQTCTGGAWGTCTSTLYCGDGIINGPEVCDGLALGGQTCVSQGFSGGTLTCQSNCAAFNTAGCTAACTTGDTQYCTYGPFQGAQKTCTAGAWGSCICYADIDASGYIDGNDYDAYGVLFDSEDARADCNGDHVLDIQDYLCYGNLFTSSVCSWDYYCEEFGC